MNLKQRLEQDLLSAMRAKDDIRRNVLRLALTNIKLQEVEKSSVLEEIAIQMILQKEVKTRKEVIEESRNASRSDLMDFAQKELAVLLEYLPEPLNNNELSDLIHQCIVDLGATSVKETGKVIKEVISRAAGRASNEQISTKVRELLV